MDPDIVDASSATTPDADADADADADTDADADVAPGEPSQKGEPCVCVGDGVPDSCTVTVDAIVFKLALGTAILREDAEDARAPRTFSSRARFRLLARCLRRECAPPPAPSSARISIACATPGLRCPSIDMSEHVHMTPPALTVLVMTPMLWNSSTLEAVKSTGESTDRRPMFAPSGMSPGR